MDINITKLILYVYIIHNTICINIIQLSYIICYMLGYVQTKVIYNINIDIIIYMQKYVIKYILHNNIGYYYIISI